MLEYITADEYKKLLGKESVPDNFKQLVIEASNYINYKTFGRVDKDNVPEQVQYVTCLIVDLQNEENITDWIKIEKNQGKVRLFFDDNTLIFNYLMGSF